MVGGFGGCCGTIRPRRIGPRCGNDMSPADRNDIIPVPLLTSSPFECDVKHTRPPYFNKGRKRKEKYEKPNRLILFFYLLSYFIFTTSYLNL